jgi:LPP20 lipoprotein
MRQKYLTMVACGLLFTGVFGCAFGRTGRPAWITSQSRDYPAEQYLLGVGQADSKPVAEERAYAAVAKIFRAQIKAQSKDWESFLVLEGRGRTDTERRLTLDQVTNVSTDKVLENVRIMETWREAKTGQQYALAGMNRAQAGAALQERIAELDRAVETEVNEAQQTQDKLARVRHLRRAVKNLVLRDAYNADLRIVRLSGQGMDQAYRVPELTAELEAFLSNNLMVGVEITGDQAELTRRAVIDGLIREGVPVTNRLNDASGLDGTTTGSLPELLVRGAVQLWDMAVPDQRFRYARWCSDFVIIEMSSQRIVGAVSVGGREGHLTSAEARAKAIRIMQQELTSNLAKTLAAYVYGETDPPTTLPPAACPKQVG